MVRIELNIPLASVLLETLPGARRLVGLRLDDVSVGDLLRVCQNETSACSISGTALTILDTRRGQHHDQTYF